MFFSTSHYSRIPVWVNTSRVKLLVAFRQVLDDYGQIYRDIPAELHRDHPAR